MSLLAHKTILSENFMTVAESERTETASATGPKVAFHRPMDWTASWYHSTVPRQMVPRKLQALTC